MFSQFKKIVNSSLEELERLGDSSFQQQQQQQYSQQQNTQLYPGVLNQHGRGYSESSVPTAPALGANTSEFPSTSLGRRSPNNLVAGSALGGGRGGYAAYQRPTSASSQPPAMGPSSPLAMPSNLSSSQAGTSRDGQEGFPGLGGFSGIKRSLSHLPRSSLDLSNLRTSFDAAGTSPMTPSREGRELPDWTSSAARPMTPGGSRPRRRVSARAASISGPFTPDTMTKMDPFFFASLQGLPDELKIAAFTPLPKEDADEELDQIDQELNPPTRPFNSLPITLPQIRTSNLTQSVPSSFRPSSAPAAGPAQSFGQDQLSMARSPLVEQTRISLIEQSLHNHEEVDEEEHEEGSSSLFSHTPEMASTKAASTNGDEDVDAEVRTAPSDITEASPAPVFDDLPDVSRAAIDATAEEAQVRPVPFGRLSASSTPRRGRSPVRISREPSPTPPITVTTEEVLVEQPQSAIAQSSAVPDSSVQSDPLRSTSPAPKAVDAAPAGGATTPSKAGPTASKAHEPLAARLARISRASAHLSQTPAPSQPKAAATEAPATTPNNAQAASSDLPKQKVDQAALESLLRQYTPLKNGLDMPALEQYLRNSPAVAAPGELSITVMPADLTMFVQIPLL